MPRTKTTKPEATPLVHPPFEELPPAIQAAIIAKGWPYPPDEKLKKQWMEARESMKFDDSVPLEIQQESWELIRGHFWDERDQEDIL